MQEAAARSLRRGLERLRPLAKNKTLRYGVPMMLLIIGGSFGLREFTQIRYDAQKLHSKLAGKIFAMMWRGINAQGSGLRAEGAWSGAAAVLP
ncbi:Cytochrome c oxidase assembly protein COX16 like protein [Chelonia mydas]|uniref:Cytochrome c oxidase assembly protein COX16 homolog, mitochondrial n=1 Tax=Chelonia mydas TaxID=8469 RepID=M7BNQ9_CHEMY|nr:Cytochrome c oxidase assembly protein COX16 like protein [Chelonia mydas]